MYKLKRILPAKPVVLAPIIFAKLLETKDIEKLLKKYKHFSFSKDPYIDLEEDEISIHCWYGYKYDPQLFGIKSNKNDCTDIMKNGILYGIDIDDIIFHDFKMPDYPQAKLEVENFLKESVLIDIAIQHEDILKYGNLELYRE